MATRLSPLAGPVSEEFGDKLLRACRELRECLAAGEHPAAAEDAVRLANGRLNAERWRWGVGDVTEARAAALDAALARCMRARRLCDARQVRLCRAELRAALARLAPLERVVRAARAAAGW